jgi:DNA-directed RNA polymerase specialized sigma24 family protein
MRNRNGHSRSDQTGQPSGKVTEVTAERALLPPAAREAAADPVAALISSIWRVLRGMGVTADDVAQATRLSFDRAFSQLTADAEQADASPPPADVPRVVDPLLAAAYRAAHEQWRPLSNRTDESDVGSSSVRYQGELLVLELLGTLAEPKRICLLLADMEEFSSPEIAALTGLRLDVVYDELRKARKAFARARKRSDAAGATRDADAEARELLALARERFSPAPAALTNLRDELCARYPGSAA